MREGHVNILATHTAVPPLRHAGPEVERAFERWLGGQSRELRAKGLRILRNAGVEARHSFLTLEEIFTPCGLTESMARYREHAIELGTKAVADALAKAHVKTEELDVLITTSCTGYMIPSVDAYIADALGMRPDLMRLPVTEMGCAAGASALIYAAEMLTGRPGRTAAVLNVEFPSNTMQHGNFSMENIVASALFSDGIACTVLRCEPRAGVAAIQDWAMHQVSETTGLLGYHLTDTGFVMNLDPSLPDVIGQNLQSATTPMLDRNGLNLKDIAHFVIHPGGIKILDQIDGVLCTIGGNVHLARRVMRQYGNMSSGTVVFILDALLCSNPAPGLALMMSFGPGFGAHQVLIRVGAG